MATQLLKSTFCLNLYIDYSISQSVANNTSTINLTMWCQTVGYYNVGSWTDFNGSYLGTTSKTFDGSIPNFTGRRNLYSTSMSVSHNSDGTGSATIMWKWGVNSPWGQYQNPSGSFNIKLPTIPRASTPSVNANSVEIGKSVTIYTNRASSNFTHTITWKIGSSVGTVATGVTTSTSWTLPLALANQLPNSTSGTLTLTCDTYNGGSRIGTKSINITVTVPSSMIPSISSVELEETVEGIASKFGKFVKTKSQPKVTINASGSYSSKITSYSANFDGITYPLETFIIPLLNKSGTLTLSVTVTDSRGRKGTKSINIVIADYYEPRILKMSATRCDSTGAIQNDGTYLRVEYQFDISVLNSTSDARYTIGYRDMDDTSLIELWSGNKLSDNKVVISTDDILNVDNSYIVRLTLYDYFNKNGIFIEEEIPTEATIMDFYADGTGIAFGKVSEYKNLVDINFPVVFRNEAVFRNSRWHTLTLDSKFVPYENKTTNTPKYRKIANMIEIWGIVSPTTTQSTGTSHLTIAKLPDDIIPSQDIYTLQVGSNKNTWCASVLTSSKNLTISRYGSSSFSDIGSSTWLPFHIIYFTE